MFSHSGTTTNAILSLHALDWPVYPDSTWSNSIEAEKTHLACVFPRSRDIGSLPPVGEKSAGGLIRILSISAGNCSRPRAGKCWLPGYFP